MATLKKGSFSLDLGIVKLGADLSEEDRQCAWELYTELSTRVAVTGKNNDPKCTDFSGELYIESLESLYKFFQEARLIMRRFPVGKIQAKSDDHLGILINRVMLGVLRPFLEKWQVHFRYWWEYQSDKKLPPFERQATYPELKEFLAEWSSVRWLMRKLQKRLVHVYKLISVV